MTWITFHERQCDHFMPFVFVKKLWFCTSIVIQWGWCKTVWVNHYWAISGIGYNNNNVYVNIYQQTKTLSATYYSIIWTENDWILIFTRLSELQSFPDLLSYRVTEFLCTSISIHNSKKNLKNVIFLIFWPWNYV